MTTALILTAAIAYLWCKANRFAKINSEIYRKAAMLTVLIMLAISAPAQFLNLEWSRVMVKAQNRDKEVIFTGPDYLEYKTDYGYIAYEFTDRTCTACLVCMDSISGDSLVKLRTSQNWKPDGVNKWWYYSDAQDDTIRVQADWYGGSVVFRFEL